MNAILSLLAVAILLIIAWVGPGSGRLEFLFAVVIPYAAISIFILGVVYRLLKWAKVPVPFKITTTCGQQKSLDWIKTDSLECPHSKLAVVGRMLLEVLFFRSLFRNTKSNLRDGPQLVYGVDKWLWLGAMAFHWSFLIIFIRHYRLFTEPVPSFVTLIQSLDGFFQIGVPVLYFTDVFLLAAVTYLFVRRVFIPRIRYISLPADYFPLLVILVIGASGVLMRHFWKVDIIDIKELVLGLMTLSPVVPEGIGYLFYIHLFFVSILFAYFPFSKLVHMGGVFLSPTRNLTNNNRIQRHINPWNPDVKVHTYEEYEDEFRDVMTEAGMPLEKDK